ncbi:unnamed protein product [Lupinus luteus]|uniref:Reverse transcriptase domain-containing protein n=1 Tax=Lupinus luteus TaxID=3873 RepID=A0AAV1YH35_LUPLU
MMQSLSLFEAESQGPHFTWSNKQMDGTIYSRIDRAICNVAWFQKFQHMRVEILPSGISDHAPILIQMTNQVPKSKSHLFRFLNYLTKDAGFLTSVKQCWDQKPNGRPMYSIWMKLKRLQTTLKLMGKKYSDISEQLQTAMDKLAEAQQQLLHDKFNPTIILTVKNCTEHLLDLHTTEENMLKQKSKINWLQLGDGNNSFFHATVKDKSRQKEIIKLTTSEGNTVYTQEEIKNEVMTFYKNLIGTNSNIRTGVNLIALRKGKCLNRNMSNSLTQKVMEKEVWTALNNIGDNKVPGIGGYNSHFFKIAWEIVKVDVLKAVNEFFEEERIYPNINCTLVTIIPKHNDANTMKDMRPISCYTTIYNIISKILTTRLGRIIEHVVDDSQSAFIPGRVIHDNIILAQELVRGYDRKGTSPRCMIQMDIQKAYDTLEWDSLKSIMTELGFPQKFVRWTMLCVSTVTYKYSVNGAPTSVLHAKRGLRQGDSISPLLFALVMEYLHRLLQELQYDHNYNFHPKCEKMGITNLCFADDLLLFCRGDHKSVQPMMEIFKMFSESTGLKARTTKCKVYFGGVDMNTQKSIQQTTGFSKGCLPFKYLGVPLDSKKLTVNLCTPLIDKITNRLKHWSTRLLSYAGRLQLIRSVLFFYH